MRVSVKNRIALRGVDIDSDSLIVGSRVPAARRHSSPIRRSNTDHRGSARSGASAGSTAAPTMNEPCSSNPRSSQRSVPFDARCELTIQPPTPVGPGLLHQIDTGTCQATHLGRAELTSDKIINIVAGTQTLETTFVAANGDVLRGAGTGTNMPIGPGRVAFTATLTFTGGTGRFAAATGQATITGEADLVPGGLA